MQSKADQEQALQVQEIAHLRTSNDELQKREQDLTKELKQLTQAAQDQKKSREDELQAKLLEALRAKIEAEEKAQDLAEQMESTV